MREMVEETFGEWDENWQQAYFRNRFSPEDLLIIQVEKADGSLEDAGVFCFEERAEEVFVGVLQVIPKRQRMGIGTQVMKNIMDEAEKKGKQVALKVLKSNRSARNLYQRLGFGVTGETNYHYVMAYEPKKE